MVLRALSPEIFNFKDLHYYSFTNDFIGALNFTIVCFIVALHLHNMADLHRSITGCSAHLYNINNNQIIQINITLYRD